MSAARGAYIPYFFSHQMILVKTLKKWLYFVYLVVVIKG